MRLSGGFLYVVCSGLWSAAPFALALAEPVNTTPSRATTLQKNPLQTRSVTAEDVTAALRVRPSALQDHYSSDKVAREALVKHIAETRALAQEARRRGLDAQPATVQNIERVLADALMESFIQNLPPVQISEKDILRFYETHLHQYSVPAMARTQIMVLGTREDAQRILSQLRMASKKRLKKQFEQLATQHSLQRSLQPLGHDVGWVLAEGGSVDAGLTSALFASDGLGLMPKPIEASDGRWIVAMVETRQPEEPYPFEEVAESIRSRLRTQRIEESKRQFIQSLLK